MLTKDQVRHIAKLARLDLNETEIEKFTKQLSAILEHAEMLKEVNTEGVEPIAQITGLTNIQAGDEPRESTKSEALLECSPQPKKDGMIKVKNIF
ncbi:Asp-tRNA(Asn)/Glu-tRNA(Gln) amidotransferase subunit GatC [Candidatus Peregrinibacteria bacterium]|nr:Asp-tRNA(Asn)/Glu-tRNA(Gln) amidotransferase subunit GatC [Candidatus Peregrinibacteria bacterium]